MSKVKFDVVFKCSKDEDEDSSVARFSADPIVTSFPFLNGNNFLFTPECLEKQAATMAHRPLNFMHNERDIVGHCIRCTTTKNLPKHVADAGSNALKVSGVFYKMLNRELYDEIVAAGKDGFKVSMEAISKKVEWVLYDGEESSILDTNSYEIVRPDQDPELHAIGRLYLWMFGTVRGLRYNDKNVAVLLGGQEGDLEFVGLALTDERMGPAAADQNTRFEFNATSIQSGEVTMRSLCHALTSMDKDELEKLNMSESDARSILDQFEEDFGEKLVQEIQEPSEDFDNEFYVGDPQPLSVGSLSVGSTAMLSGGSGFCSPAFRCVAYQLPVDGVIIPGEPSQAEKPDYILDIKSAIDESSAAIKSIASLAQERVDFEKEQNESLKAKILDLEFEIEDKLSVAKAEFDVMADQMNKEILSLKEKNDSMKGEIHKLRTFELVCMGASIEFCDSKNLGSMSQEEYSHMKSSLDFEVSKVNTSDKDKNQKIDFKSQTKRICSK